MESLQYKTENFHDNIVILMIKIIGPLILRTEKSKSVLSVEYKHFFEWFINWLITMYKGPFTSTCKGGLMQKKIIKIFQPPQTSKNFHSPPLFAMKIMGQPHRKACKLNFYWKICGNFFFKASLYKGQKF